MPDLSSSAPNVTSSAPDVPSASTPALLSLAEACPKIQDALDASFPDEVPRPEGYRRFAQAILTLINETDPKDQNILDTLARTMEQVADDIEDSGALDGLQAEFDGFRMMDRVRRVCRDEGVPLKSDEDSPV